MNDRDLMYRFLTDNFTIDGKFAQGRTFRYRIGDLLRQIPADHQIYHLEAMADQAMREKYRFCQWDREHLTVNSEAIIREVVMWYFKDYLDWKKSKSENAGQRVIQIG